MKIPIYTVDAFASERFTGNPAAVCLLTLSRDEAWMQSVAREMNLSETAFVLPKGPEFYLRWFTPKVEIALCGHATLASAHVLWESGRVAPGFAIKFHTKSGVLACTQDGERIEMDFPAKALVQAAPPEGLEPALGAKIVWSGRSDTDWLFELESEEQVRALAPDLAAIGKLPVRGVIVTARAGKGHDFVSRFFAPAVGVPEDPVTGSAHCALAPYWAAKLGKTELVGWQASQRGGEVSVRLVGARVFLGGRGLTIVRGELLV